MKKELVLEFLSETIKLLHDPPHTFGGSVCRISRDVCGSICMVAGTRYHVASRIKHGRSTTIKRYFRNLFTSHYTKQPNL